MSEDIMEWYDMVILILVMCAGLLTAIPLMTEWRTPIVTNMKDKTLVEAHNISDSSKELYGRDLFNMLLISDHHIPEPKAIKINNSDIITLDSTWYGSKDIELSRIYNTVGLKNMLNWKITSVKYIEDGAEIYWHYTLEEVSE